jgi:hypothetical protein
MTINFNHGDKVQVNTTFVETVLASRPSSGELKSLLYTLRRVGSNSLIISNIFPSQNIVKITQLGTNYCPNVAFESHDDLNNSFTLLKAFTSNTVSVTAQNGSREGILKKQFVTLVGYTGSNPEIPIVHPVDMDDLSKFPIFGMSEKDIPRNQQGTILVEGFFAGIPTGKAVLHDDCYIGYKNGENHLVPGSYYHGVALTTDPSTTKGMIYLFKQPGGDYSAFEPRSYAGEGNDRSNLAKGSTHQQLKRLGAATYEDGLSEMPSDRPNPRHISNVLCAQDQSQPNSQNVTDYLWVWGQFLDHDIGLTEPGSTPESADITIPDGDPIFPPGTLRFNRSSYDPTTGTTNVREQLTSLTPFIDASNVYGNNYARAMELRTKTGDGKLRTTSHAGGDLLPKNTRMFANAPNNHNPIFYLAGDIRANEQLILLAMHTVWVREHNRIVDEIAAKNSHLTGEQLYQAARRKVACLMQAITFNEFLPTLLGSSSIPRYSKYNPKMDPSITNEFSTGLYRLGHSMVSEHIQRRDVNLKTIPEGWSFLRDAFFRPDRLTEGGSIDPLLRGAARQVCQSINLKVVSALRNFLFGNPGAGGLDLAAVNIQRGRDHGLPTYNQMREALGLKRKSFAEISSDSEIVSNLESLYDNVDDIDLWVGVLAEDHVEGALVGETLQKGLLKQFLAIRDGDRFWYENIFRGSLLEEINNTTLADVIKRNTEIGSEIQDSIFYL